VIRRSTERGAAAVELALLMPSLLIVLSTIIDLGGALSARVRLNEAVQDGVAYASQHPGSPTATRQRVAEASHQLIPANVTVVCSGTNPVIVTVRATHTHHWPFGFVLGGSTTLTAEVKADVTSTTSCVSG
jgi:Flp pilus assembly protein TadG